MLLNFLKDILFPIYCVRCEKEGEGCCEKCLATIEPRITQECPVCYKEGVGAVCGGCGKLFGLDGALALYQYQDSAPLGQLIKEFKYTHARETVKIFRTLIERAYHIYGSRFEQPVTLIPIPLHERRKRERGFNQAEVFAKIMLKIWKIHHEDHSVVTLDAVSLVRQRYTEQQARLSHDKRVENLEDAFVWKGKATPRSVILVDDVFTTGSTLQAASESLKKMGVESVWGLTLARGKMS